MQINGFPIKIKGFPLQINGFPIKIKEFLMKLIGFPIKVNGFPTKYGFPVQNPRVAIKIPNSGVVSHTSKTACIIKK